MFGEKTESEMLMDLPAYSYLNLDNYKHFNAE